MMSRVFMSFWCSKGCLSNTNASLRAIGAATSIDDKLTKQDEKTVFRSIALGIKDSTAKTSVIELKAMVVDNEEKKADNASVFRGEKDKHTNGTVIKLSALNPEKSSADSMLIRIEKGCSNTVASVCKENASLENALENGTLPAIVCWKIECPDCSKLETPQRCFGRVLLTITVRMIFFLVALALLACCVIIVNHKGKSMMQQSNEKIKLVEDIESGDHQIDEEGNCKQALCDHRPT